MTGRRNPLNGIPALWLGGALLILIGGGLPGRPFFMPADDALFDSYYVVFSPRLHVSFVAAFVVFAAIYAVFRRAFGVSCAARLAAAHFLIAFTGAVLILLPSLWLSMARPPKQYVDYPASFAAWSQVSTAGYLISWLSYALFAAVVTEALVRRLRRAPR